MSFVHRTRIAFALPAALLALLIAAFYPSPGSLPARADAPQATPAPLPPYSYLAANAFEPRFAFYYKPPENIGLDQLARVFSLFILNPDDTQPRDQLLGWGARRPILAYLRSEAIHDPGSCTAQPWRNNVAFQPGDFCAISQQHPDWFLLDKDGNRIHDVYQDKTFYLMDPANPGWQQFFIQRAQQVLADPGWDGIFLDNFEVTLNFRQQQNELPVKYPTDEAYWLAHESFAKALYTGYFAPNHKLLFANIVSRKDESKFTGYLTYLDGAMHEGWSIDRPNRWRPVSVWEKQVALAEQAQKMGKFIILVGQGAQDDYALQRFAYASYLLAADGRSAFRYGHSSSYRQAWVYDNYAIDLGAPLGPRYADGPRWRRDFTNGSVTVDPLAHSVAIGNEPDHWLFLPITRR